MKRDSVRRATIQRRHATNHLSNVYPDIILEEEAARMSEDEEEEEEPEEEVLMRGRKRKASSLSLNSIEEVDYSSEYCYSNCRVFPVSFQPHLRNKIDKDNLEFDEEIQEKKQRRLDIIRRNNRKKNRMKETYRSK